MFVARRRPMVTVRRNRDQVQFAEPDPTLGPDGDGERAHLCRVTLEHDALQAIVMVQVHVKGRHHQIVMLVAVSWGTAEHGDWRGYAPRAGDAFARKHVQMRISVPHPIIDTPPVFEGVPITV